MSIEVAPKPAAAGKAASGTANGLAKPKLQGAGQDDEGAGLGFQAVLASVDDSDSPDGGGLPAMPFADTALAPPALAQPQAAMVPTQPANLPLGQDGPPIVGGLQQSLAAQADAALSIGGTQALIAPGVQTSGLAQAGVVETSAPQTQTAASSSPPARPEPVPAATDALLAAPIAPPGGTRALQHSLLRSRADGAAATATQDPAAAGSAQAPIHAEPDMKLFTAMEAQRAAYIAPQPVMLVATSLARTDRPWTEPMAGAKDKVDGTYAGASFAMGSSGFDGGSTTGTLAPAGLQPEVQTGEPVKYWISPDVQNAELKLDGLGDTPVEVSIRMHGNEAHLAFRSDELQTRSALEDAGSHLKDALQREGVVLMGVSVGTSGSGEGGNGDGRPRPGARQGRVLAAQQGPVQAGRLAASGAGRSIDLFV